MSDVFSLFGTSYFIIAMIIGAVSVALIWLTRLSWKTIVRPLPVVGVVIAVTTAVTVHIVEETADPGIYPALAGLLVLVGLAAIFKAPLWVQAIASIPGAIWLGVNTTATESTAGRLTLAVAIPVAGMLLSDFELRHEGLGLGVICYALAAFGVFGAIPDTEWALPLIAVTTMAVFAAWPRVGASMGSVGAFVAVAVLVWVALEGGAARPASVVGSVACLGILLIEPILTYVKPSFVGVSKWVRENWAGAILAAVPQFMLVRICSRIAARFTDPLPAFVIVGFAFIGAFLIGWFAADTHRKGIPDDSITEM